MAKFNIGDPVFVLKGSPYGSELYGKIVSFDYGQVGIQFEENQYGAHGCDGAGKDGYCWWIFPKYVSLALPKGMKIEDWNKERKKREVIEKIKFLDQKFHDRQKRKTNGVKVRRTCRMSALPLPR